MDTTVSPPPHFPKSSDESNYNALLIPRIIRAIEIYDNEALRKTIAGARETGQLNYDLLSVALMRSSERGNIKALEYLLGEGAPPNGTNETTRNRLPPLLRAVNKNHIHIVQLLLKHGATIEVEDKTGKTALMRAALEGHYHILTLLLRHGADVNRKDHWGRAVLHHLAMDKGGYQGDVVDSILQAPDVAIDGKDELGRTPLHWACSVGNLHIVKVLLEGQKGLRANINAVEARHKTSLCLAVAHKKDDVVRILLQHGADLNLKSDGGWTPLHVACENGSEKIVEDLLSCGANINSKLVNGVTPLHLASQADQVNVVKRLLEHIDIVRTPRDMLGRTPFLLAAQNNRRQIIRLLAPSGDEVLTMSRAALGACRSIKATIVDFGDFHNGNQVQRRTIYDLIYTHNPATVLPKQANFRWIHLPANNTAWAEALFRKWLLENEADLNKHEVLEILERSLTRQQGDKAHLLHMMPTSEESLRTVQTYGTSEDEISPISAHDPSIRLSSKHDGPKPVIAGFTAGKPKKADEQGYLPTDVRLYLKDSGLPRPSTKDIPSSTARKRPRKIVTPARTHTRAKLDKDEKAVSLRRKSPNIRIAIPKDNHQHQSGSEVKGAVFTFLPYLHFETQRDVDEVHEVIRGVTSLSPFADQSTPDEMLIHGYLTTNPPCLHVRRELDPSASHTLRAPGEANASGRVLMIDQLWMWMLNENLVITAFPQRWKQPRNDPLNVLESIIMNINSQSSLRQPIASVHDLSTVITAQCLGSLSRMRTSNENFHFLDKFETFIDSAAELETKLSKNSEAISTEALAWLQYHGRRNRQSKPNDAEKSDYRRMEKGRVNSDDFDPGTFYSDKLLDVRQETDLLTNTKNIRDEFRMASTVLQDQLQVVGTLENIIRMNFEESWTAQEKVGENFMDQLKMVHMNAERLRHLDTEAFLICNSVMGILEAKAKHANAFEAVFAREEAAETARQLRNTLLFATMFLPVSFGVVLFLNSNGKRFSDLLIRRYSLMSNEAKELLKGGLILSIIIFSAILLFIVSTHIKESGRRLWNGSRLNAKEKVGADRSIEDDSDVVRVRIQRNHSNSQYKGGGIQHFDSRSSTGGFINKKADSVWRKKLDASDDRFRTGASTYIHIGTESGTGKEIPSIAIPISEKGSREPDTLTSPTNDADLRNQSADQAHTPVPKGDTFSDQSPVQNTPLEIHDSLPWVPNIINSTARVVSNIIGFLIGSPYHESISRLSWTCRCGHRSHDDFTQLTPTGLQEMADELQSSGFITNASVSTKTTSKGELILSRLSAIAGYIGSLRPRGRSKQDLPLVESQISTSTSYLHPPRADCKFLHVCVEKGRYSTRLHHIDICDKKNDRAIFHTLRKDYKELRRELNSILFKIRRIDFVEFQVYPKSLADSIVPDQLPPPPPQNIDYEYFPVPPRTKPPIGGKFMMHMWHCKEEVPEKDFFTKRFPKKMREPCKFVWEDSETANIGWGLHIVETLNISLLVWIAFAFTALVGLVFAISWTVLKEDISGAYTVASYITALMTLLLMAVMSVITGI